MAQLRLRDAKEHSEAMYRLRGRLSDESLIPESYHHYFGSAFLLGENANAIRLCTEAIAADDPERRHVPPRLFLGHDSVVCANACLSLALALDGQMAKARLAGEAGVGLAERLRHPLSITYGHYFAGMTAQSLRDVERCRTHAEALIALSHKYDFALEMIWGKFLLGWALAQGADRPEGLGLMQEAYRRGPIDPRYRFLHCSHFAAVLLQAGQAAEALAIVDALLAEAGMLKVEGSDSHEGIFVPELWRVKGEALLQVGGRAAEADACFRAALADATRQGAPLLRLRAAQSLARLIGDQGRRLEAGQSLMPVVESFAAESTHPEWLEARRLLDQLR
jgi:tetratricopeptide (TPR) repeat protein